jgi:general secretion pathway protein G
MNGKHTKTVRRCLAAGECPRRRATAFTLIEILIVVVILGILAAVVLPQFSDASHITRENTAKDDLRYLRTQVAVYKAQHKDVPAGYLGSTAGTATEAMFVSQMTGYTDEGGNTGPQGTTYKFGPYLSKLPPNPINGLTSVKVLQSTDPLPTAPTNAYGWIYQPTTQTFLSDATGSDRDGVRYFDY